MRHPIYLNNYWYCNIKRRKRYLWLTFSHIVLYMYEPKRSQINGLFTIPIHLLIIHVFVCPFLFHFCELVCSLLYSSMNLLALVVKFLNMLLCFYLNSSLLYASSIIRTLNKLYKNLPFIVCKWVYQEYSLNCLF